MALRFMTAGESHGPVVAALVEGMPAALPLTPADIDRDLARRQAGYGRGGRMRIEADTARILSGVRHGATLGSPILLVVENRDHQNWRDAMAVEAVQKEVEAETRPRPGHGDAAGMLKFGTRDARDVLERASARETAARVAAGALARRLLDALSITVVSRVISVGAVQTALEGADEGSFAAADDDPVRCPDPEASKAMLAAIDAAAERGDSLGGVFEVAAFGLVPGLGSHVHYDRRLDGRLVGALASVPAIKGVEVGLGFAAAGRPGSEAHDEIHFKRGAGLYRDTDRAGGLEAGMTNGEPLLLRAAMKPIPSLARPLATVDMETLQPAQAFKERADVCAVPAAAVVGEAVVALVLADAVLEKFGGDSLPELKRNYQGYLEQIARYWKPRKPPVTR